MAAVACPAGPSPAGASLILGQYASNGPSYQVEGAISGLKIYHRALSADEVAERAHNEQAE